MSEVKISVIVPIYNVEQYLDDCLESIKNQTFADFEVILVDDGSTDGSIEIAKKYEKLDGRFTLYIKNNGGAADARNYGIEKAKGKYLAFIDSDDTIMEKYLENLYNAIIKYDADVAVCDFCFYFINKGKTVKANKLSIGNNRIYNREQALKELLCDAKFRFYLWNKLWKKSLFKDNNIYMPDMFYEDIVVCSKVFCHINRAVSIDYCGYTYKRAVSKHQEVSMSKIRINDYIRTVPYVRKYLGEKELYKIAKKSFFRHVFHVFFSVPLLVIQANKSLEKGIIKNSVSGMKTVIKSLRVPIDELDDMINGDAVV